MKKNVYLEAAKLIHLKTGWKVPGGKKMSCCEAIKKASNTYFTQEHELHAFSEMFKPFNKSAKWDYWWNDPYNDFEKNEQQARVLALLFMHEMTK